MILIGNGRLLTRNGAEFFENGAVAVEGRYVQEVGTTADLRAKYPDAEWIDAKGGVIMPALG